VDFAAALFRETERVVPNGERHFADLWPRAVRLLI
jgi:hypothetical protein